MSVIEIQTDKVKNTIPSPQLLQRIYFRAVIHFNQVVCSMVVLLILLITKKLAKFKNYRHSLRKDVPPEHNRPTGHTRPDRPKIFQTYLPWFSGDCAELHKLFYKTGNRHFPKPNHLLTFVDKWDGGNKPAGTRNLSTKHKSKIRGDRS